MAKFFFFFFLCLCLLSWSITSITFTAAALSKKSIAELGEEEEDHINGRLKTYIIHVDSPKMVEKAEIFLEGLEKSMSKALTMISRSSSTTNNTNYYVVPRMIYSYKNILNGFAARLSEGQLSAIKANIPGFLHAIPDTIVPLATTHTPLFLGLLPAGGAASADMHGGGFSMIWNETVHFGRGVIVGVLDTGILPDHPSFSGDGMPSPPAKWKGRCDFNSSSSSISTCNNKIIGARTFLLGAEAKSSTTGEPRDTFGHGTHVASTAVGRFVGNASVLGNAAGTAVGMAPEAHLAVYKVCTERGCAGSDILAALDAAVEDGVDILSLSFGKADSKPFDQDPTAAGTLAAVEKGIFVCMAGGNDGPRESSISNEAPWMLTVGASTMDRTIRASVKLGNGAEYHGESLYQTSSQAAGASSQFLPLVYPGANGSSSAKFCSNNSSFVNVDVKGKIVVCDQGGGISRISKGEAVRAAGGAAFILASQEANAYTTLADAHVLLSSFVSFSDATKIKAYIASSSFPTAMIIPRGTLIGVGNIPAPTVAAFSSRGPSLQSKGILKPDIIGPGVNVLAGWPALGINDGDSNSPALMFNIISGTSMSTPHLSGIAALIKSAHPSWSPAMIRSALMTTAGNTNIAGQLIADEQLRWADLFSKGAGHVDPRRAINSPGLVYDIQPEDYIAYMCGLNYTDRQLAAVARRAVSCSSIKPIFDVELNYPSFSVEMGPSSTRKVSRTVTNVGQVQSTYKLEMVAPEGIEVDVSPVTLSFSRADQKLEYTVEFRRKSSTSTDNSAKKNKYAEGYLSWVSSDQLTIVRSAISITFIDTTQ
ncbi:Subtilisin-like protease SDD1 [Apostasia shenzhenica]|uniref:Subtilisin-like protease SDD1 n=1 Tax=Apostasia shenzhenica TaxID=1088818 RepID=A0A2I0BBT2_9ASPA|nr:Subtilisin-like protease SDD1 [Apostasia shenzhenica]